MAFIVEDGTGEDPLANSYNTEQEFRDYWNDRTLDTFDHTQYGALVIQRALVRGTDYIENRFRNRFKGMRLVYDPPQPLSFPRANLIVHCVLITGVPQGVKNALNEYAKRILTTTPELQPDPGGFDATGQLVGVKRVKVGPIETESRYEAGSATTRAYPAADAYLQDFLYPTGGVIRN